MIRRSTLLTMVLAVSTGLALFVVKYKVQDLEDRLNDINREIASNRQSIHVLKAEWSHLNEPGRLRQLAVRHLDLGPLGHDQFISSTDLTALLPERNAVGLAEDDAAFDQQVGAALVKEVLQ